MECDEQPYHYRSEVSNEPNNNTSQLKMPLILPSSLNLALKASGPVTPSSDHRARYSCPVHPLRAGHHELWRVSQDKNGVAKIASRRDLAYHPNWEDSRKTRNSGHTQAAEYAIYKLLGGERTS